MPENPDSSRKQRADLLLVARGVFESRKRAQDAIAAGLVKADGETVRKSSQELAISARIEAMSEHPWVSRGGLKLEAALEVFGVDPSGQECLDIGSSTGGFSHVLLTRGARHVTAVDVGSDQLHPSLRDHPALTSRENTDIRSLTSSDFVKPPQLIVIDVSFIPLGLVLPAATALATDDAALVVLIKPQFEVGKAHLKKGIVRDEATRLACCSQVREAAETLGWRVVDVIPSPIAGGDGNVEYLMGARRG